MTTTTSKNRNAVKDETMPYFFLVTDEYALGTPKGIISSDRTRDVPFNEFARNYELQERLRLLSTVFLKPNWNSPLAYPSEGNVLLNDVACYLAAFAEDSKESKLRKKYLTSNGLVRILVIDDKLRKELDELQTKQDTEKVYATLSRYERSFLSSPSFGMDKVGTDFLTNQPIFRRRKK